MFTTLLLVLTYFAAAIADDDSKKDSTALKEYEPPKRKTHSATPKSDAKDRKPALCTPIIEPAAAVAVVKAKKRLYGAYHTKALTTLDKTVQNRP